MTLFVTGVSHDTAPVQVREQLTLTGEKLEAAFDWLKRHVGEAVVISTCNRLEVYAHLPMPGADANLLSSLFPDASAELEPHAYRYKGRAAAHHLFEVAAGLDSLVLGEVEILGQVQRAWQEAHRAGLAGPVLSQLFHRAVALGKRAHSETSISRLPASVSYAAVALARKVFGPDLRDRRVLVVGTGEVGEGVARCLYENGAHATVVAHRQITRAEGVAQRYRAELAGWHELPARLAASDIVISSTAAPHIILQKAQISEAMRGRESRPLHLIDLAVPRDIDPAAASVTNVHLHNIDDLHAVVQSTLNERQSAVPQIRDMVEQETLKFGDWLGEREAVPAIKHLRARADEVTRQEVERALSKLPGLSSRERRIIEAMADRIVGKLVHEPIMQLKSQALESAGADYAIDPQQLRDMFYTEANERESKE
jgi:glutamyl-tRNA reductase